MSKWQNKLRWDWYEAAFTEWGTKPQTGDSGWWKAWYEHIPKISWGWVRITTNSGCYRMGSTQSLLSITYRRKSSFRWNGNQLSVLHTIHNWLVGLHKGRQDIMINNNTFITYIVQIKCAYDQMHIDFQRRNGISGPPPPTFQLTSRGIFFFFSDKAQIGSHRP